MNREALEALSALELQQLIADAASVLAARCSASQPTGLFTFGSTSLGGGSDGTGLFSPPPRTGPTESSLFSFGGTPAPSCGSGKLFGGTGSGLFGGACATVGDSTTAHSTGAIVAEAVKAAEADGEEDEEEDAEEAELTVVNGWTPSISLEILEHVETGEESEEQLYSQRSKLYRFRDEMWKERGLGEAKLLKDEATGRVRFLLRQEKTLKVAANHFVVDHDPYCDLRLNADSKKTWCWLAQDWSEGELVVERFALKFGSEELAEKFKEAFIDAKAQNAAVMAKQLQK